MLNLLLSLAHLVAAACVTIHVLLHMRRPATAVGWIFATWGLPLLGSIAYGALAVYQGPRRIRQRRAEAARKREGRVAGLPGHEQRQGGTGIECVLRRLAPFPRSVGNALELLPDATQAFESKLAAMESAQHEIVLETFILEVGEPAQALAEVLERKVREGVEVRVLADSIGSVKLPDSYLEHLRDAGVQIETFLAPNPFKGRFQINFRNHRKILVVDGRVAFTGGRNWEDGDLGPREGVKGFLDLDVRIQGPAARDLRRVFLEDWCVASSSELRDVASGRFDQTALSAVGDVAIGVLPHAQDEKHAVLTGVIGAALRSARRSVHLITPYFVPGPAMSEALRIAALCGVDVKLLMPARSDSRVSDYASRYYFKSLLEAGAEIFLREPPFMHTKALVIDAEWTMLGSANFDQRSLHLNYELNIEIPGSATAEALIDYFAEQVASARSLEAEDLTSRSRWEVMKSNVCAMFEPLL